MLRVATDHVTFQSASCSAVWHGACPAGEIKTITATPVQFVPGMGLLALDFEAEPAMRGSEEARSGIKSALPSSSSSRSYEVW